jgi:hypothetical protein
LGDAAWLHGMLPAGNRHRRFFLQVRPQPRKSGRQRSLGHPVRRATTLLNIVAM